jgi:homoserine dehydrogenase
MRDEIIVLKFGSSVLRTAADLPHAVHEIYRWLRQHYQVIAVVSAFRGETDRLLDSVSGYGHAQPEAIARVVATGEEIATASLALDLDRFGIPSQVLDASQIQLIARSRGNDTEPVSVDVRRIREVLNLGRVAVIPGFVARDEQGQVALFGRGGSDLSALFLAHSLKARCRLIKDVDGVFDCDPAQSSSARHFDEITFVDALTMGAKIIQVKAIAFAQRKRIRFEVASLGSWDGTKVGSSETVLSGARVMRLPLKVGLLGLGTVGLGVFRELWKLPSKFEVTGIAVRRPDHHAQHAPKHLLTSKCWDVLEGVDVVVELMGGLDPAGDLVRAALATGKSVVTANKLLLMKNAECSKSSRLHYSAAVGGAVPALEAVQSLAAEGGIVALSGVLNGTCNYVLDQIAAGYAFDEAVAQARDNGFAEQDPRDDLSGSDTVCKLHLLAHRAFADAESFTVHSRGIEEIDADWVRSAVKNNGRVRLVGRAVEHKGRINLIVAAQEVCADHPFAAIRNEENCLVVETEKEDDPCSLRHVWTGRGAGRWPTTTAVMADLLDIYREHHNRALSGMPCLLAGGGLA